MWLQEATGHEPKVGIGCNFQPLREVFSIQQVEMREPKRRSSTALHGGCAATFYAETAARASSARAVLR